jgi:hypothetical protein
MGVERDGPESGQTLEAALVVLVEVAAVDLVGYLEQAVVEAVLAHDWDGQQAPQGRVCVGGLGEPTPLRVALDLVLGQSQSAILVDDNRVQADAAARRVEVAKGRVLVGERKVLPAVSPVARDDQAHRPLVRADQSTGQLTADLQRCVDAGFELG